MFGLSGHVAPTTIDKSTGRKVKNESDIWSGVGDATRVARRRDRRFLVAAWRKWAESRGTIEVLAKEEIELIRHAMRKLRNAIGRIRELMVRSRMRAQPGMPMALVVRDVLGLRVGDDDGVAGDNDDENEPMRGSAASHLALLHRGSYVLTRRIETAQGGSKTVLSGQWRVARVVSDVARKQDGQTGLTRRLWLVEGVAVRDSDDADDDEGVIGDDGDDDEHDDEGAALEFVEIPGNVQSRKFGDVFPAPRSRHSSGLYVIEPQDLEHSARGDVVRFTAGQIEEFDRVARSKRWWDDLDSDGDSGDSGDSDGAVGRGDRGGSSSGGGRSSSGGAPSRGGGSSDAPASDSQANDERDERAQVRLQGRPLG